MKNNIRNLKTDDNGWFTTGQFDSESFLPGEMNIMIFTDDGASIEDADRCIEHFNSLAGKSGVLEFLFTVPPLIVLPDLPKELVLVKHILHLCCGTCASCEADSLRYYFIRL